MDCTSAILHHEGSIVCLNSNFIVVSAAIGSDHTVLTLKAGADDYVLKGNLRRLTSAVKRALRGAARRRARRNAQQESHRLASFMRSSDDAIISTDPNGVISSWNPAAVRLYGWNSAEAIGRDISLIIPPDRSAETAQIMRRLQRGERIRSQETKHLRRDGSSVDVSLTISAIRDAAGRLVGVSKTAYDITERKRIAEAMAPDALLLANVRDSIILTDLDGIVTYWNDGAARLFGWTAEEMVGRPLLKRFPIDVGAQAVEITHTIAQGKDFAGEWEDWRKDGSRIWIEGRVSRITDALGKPVGILALSHDISERKQLDQQVKMSELRFRCLFESNVVAMGYWRTDGLITSANTTLLRLIGYSKEEVEASKVRWTDITPPDQLYCDERAIREIEATGTSAPFEKEYIRKDGTRVPVLIAGAAFGEGTVDAGAFVAIDLTERKKFEEAERKQRRILHSILSSMSDGVIVTDENGKFLLFNPAAEEIFGPESPDIAPEQWSDQYGLYQSDQVTLYPSHDLPLAKAARGEVVPITELFVRNSKTPQGAWLSATASVRRNEAGEPCGGIIVFRNITERKRLEEQLRQSQKMEAIGQLAGGIAHDFNNMLSVILGYSEVLEESQQLDLDDKESLGEIRVAAERAAALTSQLLAFSRKQVLEPKVLKLNDVVHEMEKMLRRTIGEDIELITILAPKLWPVKIDPGRLGQVIMNLAVNARDAMQQGGRLTLETCNIELNASDAAFPAELKPGCYVMLTVSDTGCGMDGATKRQLFEPFFTTKEPGKGTGLGLASVYGIVTQSAGYISAASEPGQGAVFTLYFPRVEGVIDEAEPKQPKPIRRRGGEAVLVVEDEEMVRRLVCRSLRSRGYQVLDARNGGEALLTWEQHDREIDLLVTDVVMPLMSGRQLWQHLQVVKPSLKVLYMSGYTNDAIVRHGVHEAEISFIQKPFSPDALASKVREVLDRTP